MSQKKREILEGRLERKLARIEYLEGSLESLEGYQASMTEEEEDDDFIALFNEILQEIRALEIQIDEIESDLEELE